MKKFLVAAIFGLAGLAAFAGTCTITHMSIVQTDGSHMTIGGQVDNNSGANILQHNILVAFLDSGNNLVETQSVPGCLNSVPDGHSDFFSATSTHAASTINSSLGLARIAFDSTFRVGTTSSQDVTISNITASRTTSTTPATLTVTGKVTNNTGTLYSPNVCTVVRTSAGNVLITGRTSLSDISSGNNRTFTDTFTVPNDSTASSVDIWVDGHDSAGVPTTPESLTGTSVTTGSNKLAWTTTPENNTGGIVFTNQPKITLQDSAGNTLTGATDSVTLSISSGPAGGALTCTTNPKAAVAGVATFAGCSLNVAGAYVLSAAASGYTSATSGTITITVGAAHHFGFTTQPSATGVSGTPLAQQPAVQVQDAGGNAVAAAGVAVTISSNPGGSGITCTPNPVNTDATGKAQFAGCTLTIVGTYTLLASGAYAQGTSSNVVISAGVATKLVFTTQPPVAVAHAFAMANIVVTIEDAAGNVVPSTSTITLAISPAPPAAGVLTCTSGLAVAASGAAGTATFTGCQISVAGNPYTLTATTTVPVLTSPVSSGINVT